MLCCVTTIFAQNDKISYQAVVRDPENKLVANKTVKVIVNIFNGTETTAVYTETQTTQTNYNGLFSMMIGPSQPNPGWNSIQWNHARIETSVSLADTPLASLEMPLTAVPYAFYADSAALAGHATYAHYSDSVNLNVIAHYLETHPIPSDAGQNVQSDYAETDATSDAYIQHKPNIRDSIGTYLTNNHYIDQTALYNQGYLTSDSTVITDLQSNVMNLQTNVTNLQSNVTNLQDGIKKAALCDSITDCVTNIIDAKLADTAKYALKSSLAPVATSGNYNDLTNTPTIPTNVSAFTNDAGYITGYAETQTLADVTVKGNSAGNRQLKNVSDPTDPQDAVTKSYLTAQTEAITASVQQQLNILASSFQQQLDSLGSVIEAQQHQLDILIIRAKSCPNAPTAGTCSGSTFVDMGFVTIFWSSVASSSYQASYQHLSSNDAGMYQSYNPKEYGFSVRCLRD